MIPFDEYFHDGVGPANGWEVLDRLRRAHPAEPSVSLLEVISATSGSPPDTKLAIQAVRRSGVSAEEEAEESLDVDRVIQHATSEASEDAGDVLDRLETQVKSAGGPNGTGPSDEDLAESQRRDALAVEFAAGSPAVLYLREISKARLLTADEEVTLAREVRAGKAASDRILAGDVSDHDRTVLEQHVAVGADARRRLIESNLRLVVSVARRYIGRGMAFLDLVQEGNLGLNRGIDKYDPERGYRFSTYVY